MRCRALVEHHHNTTYNWLLCSRYPVSRLTLDRTSHKFPLFGRFLSAKPHVCTHGTHSSQFVDKLNRQRQINTNCTSPIRTKRSQHTQAVQKDDFEKEEDGDEANTAAIANSSESQIVDEEGQTEQNANLEETVDEDPHKLWRGYSSTDRLIRLFRMYPHYAVPAISIHSFVPENVGGLLDGPLDGSEPAFRIELRLEDHDIVCLQTVTSSDLSHHAICSVFDQLASDCLQQLPVDSEPGSLAPQDNARIDYSKLLDALKLNETSIQYQAVDFENSRGHAVLLYRAQMYSGSKPLGAPQLWPDVNTAQKLARANGHADILKQAEQAGIDLDQFRLETESGTENTTTEGKKLKRSTEIPRALTLAEPRVYDFSISQRCLHRILNMLHTLRSVGLADELAEKPALADIVKRPNPISSIGGAFLKSRSKRLQWRERHLPMSPEAAATWMQRKSLPIREANTSDRIWEMVQENDVLVLVSETGSGKSTQLPQILLERSIAAGDGALCNIVCTQPRRLAATSVAERVAKERDTQLGASVGYQIRFDANRPANLGSINYSTAGVILKRLQHDSEALCDEISHLVIDEVHERDLTVDILMAFVRNLMRERKARRKSFPKIVLMSATLNAKDFQNYFAESHGRISPRVETLTVPGRTFPVTVHMLDETIPTILETHKHDEQMMRLLAQSQQYLEWEDQQADENEQQQVEDENEQLEIEDENEQQQVDGNEQLEILQKTKDDISDQPKESTSTPRMLSDPFRDCIVPTKLVTAVVAHILKSEDEGDILIFAPGMGHIEDLASTLLKELPGDIDITDSQKFRLFKLHSHLHETNSLVFDFLPPGCRRIIIATNIAQTSLTLPNVVHVIDTGKQRHMKWDQVARRNEFGSAWIDRATSLQRRGRAGRTQAGHYWAMFTEARFQSMSQQADPEMLTCDLTPLCLMLKSHSNALNLHDFFAGTPDPPDPLTIAACVRELKELGLLTDEEKITSLGQVCARFPTPPGQARALLLGRLFGCFSPLLAVTSRTQTTPLVYSRDRSKPHLNTIQAFAGVSDDDAYAVVQAFFAYHEAVSNRLYDKSKELEDMAVKSGVYRDMLRAAGQSYDILAAYGLVSDSVEKKFQPEGYPFDRIPADFDPWANSVNLFKAIKFASEHTNVAVWDEAEAAWLAKGVKCLLRPESINTKDFRRRLQMPPKRKNGELVGFDSMLRNVVLTTRPYLCETSNITPLMAMLFGGSIRMVDDATIEIDGWLRYKVRLAQDKNGTPAHMKTLKPAAIIVEFRKALERFMRLAFRDVRQQEMNARSMRNRHFLPLKDRIGRIMREGLVAILDADMEQWNEDIFLPR